jgi:hypothetical protein
VDVSATAWRGCRASVDSVTTLSRSRWSYEDWTTCSIIMHVELEPAKWRLNRLYFRVMLVTVIIRLAIDRQARLKPRNRETLVGCDWSISPCSLWMF